MCWGKQNSIEYKPPRVLWGLTNKNNTMYIIAMTTIHANIHKNPPKSHFDLLRFCAFTFGSEPVMEVPNFQFQSQPLIIPIP